VQQMGARRGVSCSPPRVVHVKLSGSPRCDENIASAQVWVWASWGVTFMCILHWGRGIGGHVPSKTPLSLFIPGKGSLDGTPGRLWLSHSCWLKGKNQERVASQCLCFLKLLAGFYLVSSPRDDCGMLTLVLRPYVCPTAVFPQTLLYLRHWLQGGQFLCILPCMCSHLITWLHWCPAKHFSVSAPCPQGAQMAGRWATPCKARYHSEHEILVSSLL
jgi:hypothetical protein